MFWKENIFFRKMFIVTEDAALRVNNFIVNFDAFNLIAIYIMIYSEKLTLKRHSGFNNPQIECLE